MIMTHLTVFLGMLGPWQVVLIVAVALLLFGGKKIPELMRGIGGGIREFKDAVKDEDNKDDKKLNS
jgi:sec-independent protein translocase protein TatA